MLLRRVCVAFMFSLAVLFIALNVCFVLSVFVTYFFNIASVATGGYPSSPRNRNAARRHAPH